MSAHPQHMRDKARRLHKQGWSYKSIGKVLGVSATSVHAWCDPKYGAALRKRQRERYMRMRTPCKKCGKPCRGGKAKTGMCIQCFHLSQGVRYPKIPGMWTPELICKALRVWNQEHGAPPTAADWKLSGSNRPSYLQVRRVFPYWHEALQAAGLPAKARYGGKGLRRFSREKAQALRIKGLTNAEIGERFGVTPQAIYYAIGPKGDNYPKKKRKPRTREEREAALKLAIAKQAEAEAILGREESGAPVS